MTASLYRKYNEFSDRESAQTEQKHRTMDFVGLPDHVLLLTVVLLYVCANQMASILRILSTHAILHAILHVTLLYTCHITCLDNTDIQIGIFHFG